MRAVEVARTGGPEVLGVVDAPLPVPGHGEVLLRAEAIGVNYIDTYFRAGLYPAALPFIVGNEVAGTVAALGAGVTELQIGDRVATAAATGGYAEFCAAPAALVAALPTALDFPTAAAALLKGLTAHYLLTSVYPVQPGDSVLVHAGSGGVGLLLTQWATRLGAKVITTTSTPEKAARCRAAGAITVLDYPADDTDTAAVKFAAQVREITGGAGVAAVYDGVGATTFNASLASLAVRGTLALFGAASGPVAAVDPQRLNTAGSVYLTRPTLTHFVRTREEFVWRAEELFTAIVSGAVKVTVSHRYPLADAAVAHRDLQGRRTVGSVVLVP